MKSSKSLFFVLITLLLIPISFAQVDLSKTSSNQCSPNTQYQLGNSICQCDSDGQLDQQCVGCPNGVMTDSNGKLVCFEPPKPAEDPSASPLLVYSLILGFGLALGVLITKKRGNRK